MPVGTGGWTIVSDVWSTISPPSNVLVIPSKIPPRGPIVAQAQSGLALQYIEGECCADPLGTSIVLIHDAVSGWWFPIFTATAACLKCDPTAPNPIINGIPIRTCSVYPVVPGLPPISVHDYIILMMEYQDADYSPGRIPTLLNPNNGFNTTPPSWTESGDQAQVFDYWTIACADSALVIQVSISNKPPPPPVCPEGTVWDPVSETCIATPIINPIRENDPEGDEITDTLCQQLSIYTDAIIKAIQALKVGGGDNAACCSAITLAIANVSRVLGLILTKLPPTGSLATIVDALDKIAAALSSLAGTSSPIDLTPLTAALDKIASAIASSPATDVSGIVDQLKQMVSEMDIPEATFDLLVQRGYMQPEERSLYQGDPVGDAIFKFLGTHGYWVYVGVMRLFGWDPTTGAPYTRSLGSDAEKLFADGFMAFVSGSDTEILPAVEKLVEGVKSLLAPASTPAVGDAGVPLDKPIAFATSVGLTSAIAAKFMAYWGWDIGEPLTKLSELISTAIGYEELRDVQIGPYIRNGIAKVADMQAKALFQQELPGASAVFSWVARGLLDSARADQLAALDGLHFSLRGPALQSAYHGMQARQLIRLSGTGLFTEGDLVDELTFSGMRPASQKRLLTAAPWLATNSQRGKLKATLEKFYIEGFLSDADLDQELAQLNHNTDGDAMSLRASQIEKQIVFAKRLEVAYSKQFISGFIVDTQYRALLEGIGLQPDWINNKVAVDQASDQAIEYRKQLAAELAAERATVAEERRAATKNYLAGNTNTAGLAGSLLLTGLNANQAAAWVDLATATRAGNLRWVYGLQLSPGDATLLRARVQALTDQRKRQLIADVAYEGALKALGIPAHWVNSLRATADAMLTPAKDAIHLPVTLPPN